MPEEILAVDELMSTTGEPADKTLGWLIEQRRATCRRVGCSTGACKRHLIRRPPAAEAIASVDVLCASLAEATELRAALEACIHAVADARPARRPRR